MLCSNVSVAAAVKKIEQPWNWSIVKAEVSAAGRQIDYNKAPCFTFRLVLR